MRKSTFFLLFVFLNWFQLFAQHDTTTFVRQYPSLNKEYFKSYWTDGKGVLLSPMQWNTRQWITASAVVGGGILLYTQDKPIHDFFMEHRSKGMDNMSKYVFEPFGNGIGTMAFVGTSYLAGSLANNDRLMGTSLTAAKSFIISYALTFGIKHLAHRHRPLHDNPADPHIWEGPFGNPEYTSFSSGHSAVAFSVATVYALEYWKTEWVPMLAYTLAAGTAVSRMYDNKHWASDVFIGSAIGCATGAYMWRQSKKNKSSARFSLSYLHDGYMLHAVIPIKCK